MNCLVVGWFGSVLFIPGIKNFGLEDLKLMLQSIILGTLLLIVSVQLDKP